MARRGGGDGYAGAGEDQLEQLFAPLGRQLLGIIEACGNGIGIENDGSRDDRACERTATGFVRSRDRPEAFALCCSSREKSGPAGTGRKALENRAACELSWGMTSHAAPTSCKSPVRNSRGGGGFDAAPGTDPARGGGWGRAGISVQYSAIKPDRSGRVRHTSKACRDLSDQLATL